MSTTDRRVGARKPSSRVDKKAGYVLEDREGKPSRKSTRKASNRQKTDTQMVMKARTAETRPRVPVIGR